MKKLSLFVAGSIISTMVYSTVYASNDLDALLNEINNLDSSGAAAATTTSHNAGEVTIENISYTTDGKDLYTVTWTPLVGNTNVKVEIKESKESDYFTLNTVKGSDGKIDIKLPAAGQYQVRLTALDSASNAAISKEYIQTIKVAGTTTTPPPTPTPPTTTTTTTTTSTPTIEKAPGVGPAEDLAIFTVIMGLMMYGIFRFRKN